MLHRNIWSVTVMLCLLVQPALADEVSDFARCLKKSGAEYYGTWWCPYCKRQNEMFGRAKSKLPYIECSKKGSREALPKCDHINSYPTWFFAGKGMATGVQSFQRLAQYSGCPAPQS